MHLVIARDWQAANDYLLLKELKLDKEAQTYWDNTGIIPPEDITALQKECAQYLATIQEESKWLGPDEKTQDYCDAMRYAIECSDNNYVALQMNLQKLKATYNAVSSPEMQAIKDVVKKLEKNGQATLGGFLGYQNKAAKIKAAVCAVPILEREQIFSNENNPACNRVRVALASHRIKVWVDPLTSDKKVNAAEAASSFSQVEKKISQFKRLKQENQDLKQDQSDHGPKLS